MSEQQTSKERVRPLTDRLISACVAGCSCLTKTPVIQYHEPLCHYRLHMEALHALNALAAVYDVFGIGAAVRTPSTLLENVKNAFRRSNCLSAIEREFFTKVVKDDDGEDMEECALSWGSDPEQYVEQFRAALAERAAHEPAAEQRPPMIDGIDSGLALQMADRADRAGYLTQNDKALIVLARAHRELRERFAKACGEVTRLSQPPFPVEQVKNAIHRMIQQGGEVSHGINWLALWQSIDRATSTKSARPCVWRTGCKNPEVCDSAECCVPGGDSSQGERDE